MKVLLISPYVPDPKADHAVADTVAQLVPRLADEVELTLYVPGVASKSDLPTSLSGVNVATSSTRRGSGIGRFFGRVPAAVRKDWPRQCNEEVRDAIRSVRPDVLHVEYLVAAEAIEGCHIPKVVTLHDVTTAVMRRQMNVASWRMKPYRLAEAIRTKYFEDAVVRQTDVVFTLSEGDQRVFAGLGGDVRLAPPGITLPREPWKPPLTREPVLLFVGALWRPANVANATFLAEQVMPHVWAEAPEARLRLVGARPTEAVRRLADANGRIEVSGYVADLDMAHREATVAMAPSLVGGGILLKVVRAMAMGCPVVTTTMGAAGVQPATKGILSVADDPEGVASAAVDLLRNPDRALAMGQAARHFIAEHYSWDRTVGAYLGAYQELTNGRSM